MLQLAAWLYGRESRQERGERVSVPTIGGARLGGLGTSSVGAGTAFLRWVSRKPELSPMDARRESLDAWMAATGASPEDVEDICELRGWALPVAIPEALEIPEPEFPEKPEDANSGILEFPEKSEPPEIAVDHRTIPGMPTRRTLEAKVAAIQFVEWVRLAGKCGTYSHKEFSELCSDFWEAEDIFPIPENTFRPVLVTLRDDITKSRSDDHYNHNGRKNRNRHYRWTVHESETESESLPWAELPEKHLQAA